jgi:hypothetical protein
MIRDIATAISFLALLAVPGPQARAQLWGRMGGWVGYGSTVQGDILRGEGVFLNGLGTYYVDSAMAGSINADTWMRLDNYISNWIAAENQRRGEHRRAKLDLKIRSHDDNINRINNNPNLSDLRKGDALNALLVPLLKPGLNESAYRFATTAVPGEAIRQIPFKIGEANATFSMNRLMSREESDWPVRLRRDEFARERKAYGDAVDVALDLMVRKKQSEAAVVNVRTAVRELKDELDRVAPPQAAHDNLFLPAKNHLDKLEKVGQIIARRDVEEVLAAIERYHGTTVGDLLMFMDRHRLQFGVADDDSEAESVLYRQLYAALLQQTDLFNAARQLGMSKTETGPRAKTKVEDEVLR